MTDVSSILAASAILFAAAFIRSALGFGEALIAVPLLSLLMPVEVAAPVAVLSSIAVALIAVVQDWRQIHLSSAVWLLLPTFVGIPIGLIALKSMPEAIVKAALGAIIVAFSIFMLRNHRRYELKTDRSAWIFGFFAGVLGGSYGMNGPPLVVFGSLRRWTPQHFRATLQAYFLVASAAGMAGYRIAGLWSARVNEVFLWSLPAAIVAVFLGRSVNRRLDPGRFILAVYYCLAAIGTLLLVQAFLH